MSSGWRRALTGGIIVLVAVIITTLGSYIRSQFHVITVIAQFDSAAGLYEGNVVAVVGMPVGKVTRITPKTGYVEAEFTVDKDVKVPADVHAVTINTSILTDRQIELTPAYRDGPVLRDHDTIGLTRTKTPLAFDRVLDMLDKISQSLSGDKKGGGPVSDMVTAAVAITDGNGAKIKGALDELSRALRLSSDSGVQTRGQLTTIITDLSSLMDAAARNDAKLRQFGTTIRELTQILADEDFGTGATGRKINELIAEVSSLIDKNRDHLKQSVQNGDTAVKALADNQREVSELVDVLPVTLENLYNAVDQENGSVRAHPLADKVLGDGQQNKEICNLMHLRQLGCGTGTLADYGPDFGLTYVLDGLSMMGQ